MGMHERVLTPLRHMYAHLRRQFKCAGSLGREYKATNGILQGCPLSIVLLNALVAVWCRTVKAEIPSVSVSAFVDDTGATASQPCQLNDALAITKEFEQLTGQQINTEKCICFSASSPNMKRLRFGQALLPRSQLLKTVGVTLSLDGSAVKAGKKERLDHAKDLAYLLQST
eukprot:9486368-Karenia_brevis.AAC.1